MIELDVKVNTKQLKPQLYKYEDRIIYYLARYTLAYSINIIPYRTGKMRRTTTGAGVQGSNKEYRIGSYTDYASKVWQYPDNTRWTTPGTTNRWFERTYNKNRDTFLENAISISLGEVE